MAKSIDREALAKRIREVEGLSREERSALLGLLNKGKKYGLVWEEKTEEVEERLRSQLPVLEEVEERRLLSPNPDSPNHIIIEGDNLEALTTLSYTHEGKIDVIYIDPPYNTGKKDFSYNDSYVDREDGYRHSKWLSFMSKRLRIAKRLLSDRGVIFISIDDNEQANLKLLCDEVFGEKNFTGQLVLRTATDNNPSQINTEHEYMLCYCFSVEHQGNWERTSSAAKKIIEEYTKLKEQYFTTEEIQKNLRKWIKENKDSLPQVSHYNNVDGKGVFSSSSNSSNPHPGGYMYDIIHPITHKACPKPANGWRWPLSTFEEYDKGGEILWGTDEKTQPHVKKRIETSTEYLRTMIYEDNRGTTNALRDIFGGKDIFKNPKPTNIIRRIIDFASPKNESIVLDFFAGSGTTLHATMQLNKEDGGKRRCILVTNNENKICEEVTYERNKRVIEGYTTPKGAHVEGLKDNNLRYYRTRLLPREKSLHNKRRLVRLSTDLLRIKEDLYEERHRLGTLELEPQWARLFGKGERQMLVIYDEDRIAQIVAAIGAMEAPKRPIKVYTFAHRSDPWEADFEEVGERVELVPLPNAIMEAYERVLPKTRDEEEAEEADTAAAPTDDEQAQADTTEEETI